MNEILKQGLLYKAKYYILIIVVVAAVVALISAIMAALVDDNSGGSGPGIAPLLCTPGAVNMAAIDKRFEDAGVFAGKQEIFIQAANENGIDPILLMSIAMHESTYGKSSAVREKNNPGGLMRSDGKGLMKFSTLDEGIQFMAGNLNRLYISQGLVTIETIW
ncbi:glucosaminidase domain-containing protein [Paenibacillus crassostreae]|uniref:glucosaminidase domain-containing protein n=1 Tax=Paenibacillus crassostreae TaxID=1763538 RepID=UPI0008DBCB63|nr:glucosaminidase domain-containing protein [Paenibacillus crassostreae]AOZ94871.1 hypothetical protein LPB68_21650 [Paenibacillus crassostreae]